MGHFAKVIDGIVDNVIVAEDDFFDTFIDTTAGEWVKTSYNVRDGKYYIPGESEPADNQEDYVNENYPERMRKNYAAIGMVYDEDRDAFYYPKPFASWTLNEDTCQWEPPIPKPAAGTPGVNYTHYVWDEDAYQADTSDPKTKGWIEAPEPVIT